MLKKHKLNKYTQHTIIDPVELKKELREVREKGFAFSDQEVDAGARAVSAPVFDHRGLLVAGLTAAGPRERITGEKIQILINLVTAIARKASLELGCRVYPK